jgi:hypothetical protein
MKYSMPWEEPSGPYSEFQTDGPKEDVEFDLGGHLFRVTATGDSGLHTGRRKYKVSCLKCALVLHPNTTGPRCWIEMHLDGHITSSFPGA